MHPDVFFRAVLNHDFPKAAFSIAIAQHMAPRTLQLGSFSAIPQIVNSSILAGCGFAIAFTRCYNLDPCLAIQQDVNAYASVHDSGNVELDVYVDDCAQFSYASTESEVIHRMVHAAESFCHNMELARLTISSKGGVTSNSLNVRNSISKMLFDRKRNIRSKPWQRYLGVSVAGGNCRNDHVIKHRFNKTRDRRKRNAKIAKTHKGARRLFNASSFTATSWGNPASGLSHSHLLELERSGVRCSGIKPQGKCRFTTCIVAYGQYHHPIARILRELFKTWFLCLATVFTDSPRLFPDLRVAWKK